MRNIEEGKNFELVLKSNKPSKMMRHLSPKMMKKGKIIKGKINNKGVTGSTEEVMEMEEEEEDKENVTLSYKSVNFNPFNKVTVMPNTPNIWTTDSSPSKGKKRPEIVMAEDEIGVNTAFDMSNLIFYKWKRILSTKAV
jgi:hypothetical protein